MAAEQEYLVKYRGWLRNHEADAPDAGADAELIALTDLAYRVVCARLGRKVSGA